MHPIHVFVCEETMLNREVSRGRGHSLSAQRGVAMIETLVAILIFSLGILGIIGLQATSIKQVSDAKYRIDAANLAEQLMGQMWADDHTAGNLGAKYATGGGAAYVLWKAQVQATLPGVSAANAPTVSVVPDASDALRSTVTITIRWQAPGATSVNQYVSTSRIR